MTEDYIDGLTVAELREIFVAFFQEASSGGNQPDLVEHAWQVFLGKVRERATIIQRDIP